MLIGGDLNFKQLLRQNNFVKSMTFSLFSFIFTR